MAHRKHDTTTSSDSQEFLNTKRTALATRSISFTSNKLV
jgi:hypothetical protein